MSPTGSRPPRPFGGFETTSHQEERAMAKVSKETTQKVLDIPPAEDRSSDLDGHTANFVTIKISHDLAPMLASLPGGNCSCPHWGYVFKGRIIVRYDSH